MARFHGSRRSRRFGMGRSVRKTRWTGAIMQADVILETGNIQREWVTFWAKWPAGRFDPQTTDLDGNTRLEPSDETLVRTITHLSGVFELDQSPGIGVPAKSIAYGLISFDGGDFPEAYEGAVFSSTSLFQPPNPATDLQDDWIWRYEVGGLVTRESFGNVSPFDEESKAKRKLPPGTGILGVVGMADFVNDTYPSRLAWNWVMHLAVRSGYTA